MFDIAGTRFGIAIRAEGGTDRPSAYAAPAGAAPGSPWPHPDFTVGSHRRRVARGLGVVRERSATPALRRGERGLWVATAMQAGVTVDEDFPASRRS